VITDMCDRLILDTCGYFINSCPNQEFCKEINPFLIPIQMGEKDAGEVLSVSRDVSEQYFREEDEAATMAEIWDDVKVFLLGKSVWLRENEFNVLKLREEKGES
ncbi:MAG: hypothetical protein ACLVGL_15750, partial [Waltera sp.]